MYAMASAAARAIVIQQETQRALTGHEPCLDWIAIPSLVLAEKFSSGQSVCRMP
jgi:hypothetical protein